MRKASRKFTATLSVPGIANGTDTTFTLSSVVGLPTDTMVDLTIDRVDSSGVLTPAKEEVITGMVSGSNIINAIRGVEGTAQAHASGAVVEVRLTASQWNDTIDEIIRLRNAPQGFLLNGKIVPSVTSNNLTVALKTLAGTDPSTSNPVHIRIGDTIRTITSALSVTQPAGTNWMNAGSSELATKEIDYFVYLYSYSTSSVGIAISRIPYGKIQSDFNIADGTNEKVRLSDGNDTATSIFENIGRFSATLSAGAGYTWTVPTFTSTNLIQRPIFETRLLDYVPTVYSWTNAPTSQTLTGYYSLCGSDCIIYGQISGTANGSNSSELLILLIPFLAKTVGGSGGKSTCIGNAQWTDNTTFDEMATIRTDVSTTERRVSYQFPTATRKPVALYFSAMFKI